MIASWLPPMGTLAGEAARGAIVLATVGALLGVAELWHRPLQPPAEWTRKFIHLTLGLVALALPWLIAWPATLLAIALLGTGPVLWARSRGGLDSLFGVRRSSYGEVFFPIAVFSMFLIGRTRPVYYLISLLVMVVCDALAALLGRAYGRHQYVVVTDRRSYEGSAVFLFTAFLAVHLPLLLMTPLDRGVSVLVAVQLALLLTAFEAIGPGGSDNLLVPLATYFLLVELCPRPIETIAVRLAAQLALLAGALLVARWTRFLTFSGAVGVHLVLYAAYVLGGATWVVAPALALAGAIAVENRVARAIDIPRGGYHVRVVYYVSLAPLLVLFAKVNFPGAAGAGRGLAFVAPFVGSLASALAIIGFWATAVTPRVRRRAAWLRGLSSAALGLVVVAPLGLLAAGAWSVPALAIVGLGCLAAVALFIAVRRMLPGPAGNIWDYRLLALSVLVATLAVLPLHFGWMSGQAGPPLAIGR